MPSATSSSWRTCCRNVTSGNLLLFAHQSAKTAHHLQALLPTWGAIRGRLRWVTFSMKAIIVLCRRPLFMNTPLICSVQALRGEVRARCNAGIHVTAAASRLVIDAAHLGIEARRRRRYTHLSLRTRHQCGCGVEVVMVDVGTKMMWRSAVSLVRSAFWACCQRLHEPCTCQSLHTELGFLQKLRG